jgi:hypothetical protein
MLQSFDRQTDRLDAKTSGIILQVSLTLIVLPIPWSKYERSNSEGFDVIDMKALSNTRLT